MDELRDLVETAHRNVVAACLWRDPAWRRRDLDELAEVETLRVDAIAILRRARRVAATAARLN